MIIYKIYSHTFFHCDMISEKVNYIINIHTSYRFLLIRTFFLFFFMHFWFKIIPNKLKNYLLLKNHERNVNDYSVSTTPPIFKFRMIFLLRSAFVCAVCNVINYFRHRKKKTFGINNVDTAYIPTGYLINIFNTVIRLFADSGRVSFVLSTISILFSNFSKETK